MNSKYSLKDRIKDEKSFAKTITINYKMSNTKNKDFVNAIVLSVEDIMKNYDFTKLEIEIIKLGFHFVIINDELVGLVKDNETRKIFYKRLITTDIYRI